MESLIKKQIKKIDDHYQNNNNNKIENENENKYENESENENGNENKRCSRRINYSDKLKISVSEFNWALDLVQTRNCRVPKSDDVSDLNQLFDNDEDISLQEGDGIDESIEINRDNVDEIGIEVMETVISEQITRKSDSISVLAPFFDLMNHDSSVNTVFELKFLPQNNGFDEKEGPKRPFLTVRYDGHGVKKGEQVCLNYRW